MAKTTREAVGAVLYELGKEDKRIYIVDNDVGKTCKIVPFIEEFPKQYVNVGIAEMNIAGIAAGLATCGKIPFVITFATFASMKMLEMVRTQVCYPNLNVKIVASHAGLTTDTNGATHQSVEDYSIMRAIPNMTVLMAADYNSAVELTKEVAYHDGPVYVRYSRSPLPDIYEEGRKFEIGKAVVLKEGKDVAIIANGDTVHLALEAYEELKKEGVDAYVVDMHTIKPLDVECVKKLAKETGKIITIEDHNIYGGLGSAVCEVVCEEGNAVVKRLGIQDRFGKTAPYKDLLKENGITVENIVKTAKEIL